jgi:hypothetical protein
MKNRTEILSYDFADDIEIIRKSQSLNMYSMKYAADKLKLLREKGIIDKFDCAPENLVRYGYFVNSYRIIKGKGVYSLYSTSAGLKIIKNIIDES